ncbi:RNaseH domain-containing protein [Spirosoma jeollabukense]
MINSDITLARYTVSPEVIRDLHVETLLFDPSYQQAIATFRQAISTSQRKQAPPLRRLNNALLACAPTLTHGFEWFNADNHRAVVVGTNGVLHRPELADLHPLINIWGQHWVDTLPQRVKKKADYSKRFLDSLKELPKQASWRTIKPELLVLNPSHENGLVYQAVPALLASLLHEKTINIGDGQQIKWRRVQGNSGDRTGLFVVSQPFQATYIHEDKKTGATTTRGGYFAYRLDFIVQTQAGRTYADGNLKPWVFLKLSCQRYAHERLDNGNFNRNTSILVGIGTGRITTYPFDGTLVRLPVTHHRDTDHLCWGEYLPELLEGVGGRKLVGPELVHNNPDRFGVKGNTTDRFGDEYLLVHAEGYKYHNRNHGIKTGFHLDERHAIIQAVIEQLDGLLQPDSQLPADISAPIGFSASAAMLPFNKYREELATRRDRKSPARQAGDGPLQTLQQRLAVNLPQSPISVLVVCQENSTRWLLHQQLKRMLLINEGDTYPAWLNVVDVHITNSQLLSLYNKDITDPLYKDNTALYFLKQQREKKALWIEFLKPYVLANGAINLALVEINYQVRKGIDPRQQPKGAIREACAQLNIASQCIKKVKEFKNNKAETGDLVRAQLSLFDLVLRQTGTLLGAPSDIYKQAGLSDEAANKLDLIALYRHQTNAKSDIPKTHLAVAVRLRVTGEVDVCLPSQPNQWIPYVEAGPTIGRMLAEKRAEWHNAPDKNALNLTNSQLAEFAAQVVTAQHERPTVVMIEADVWRNGSGSDPRYHIWPQLKNEELTSKRDILDFTHIANVSVKGKYLRHDSRLTNLLGVIRLRMGNETPQYIPTTDDESPARNFTELSGFLDQTNPNLWHYFSVGKLPTPQKAQNTEVSAGLYKLETRYDDKGKAIAGANLAIKHPQVVELVPFFIRQDFQSDELFLALCRVVHYLRSSPNWAMGNTVLPFPLHLAQCLLDDQLCILGIID